MDTYFGGIFLIDTKLFKGKGIIYTPYNDNSYPHFDYVFGMDKRNRYNKLYKADRDLVFKWLEEKNSNGQFGFQGVFNDLDTAKKFRDLFINKPETIETISIHLPTSEFDELADLTEQELEAQNPKRGNFKLSVIDEISNGFISTNYASKKYNISRSTIDYWCDRSLTLLQLTRLCAQLI